MLRRAAVMVALLLAAVPAWGEITPGAVTVSPVVGMYVFDGQEHLDTAPVLGVKLGYEAYKHLGLEAGFGYVHSHSTVKGKHYDQSDHYLYRGEALLYLTPESSFVPYLAGTVGGKSTVGNSSTSYYGGNDRDSLLLGYGIGAKWFLEKGLAVRADVRHFGTMDHGELLNYEATLGLCFSFGGAKQAKLVSEPPPAPPQALEPAPVARAQALPAPPPKTEPVASLQPLPVVEKKPAPIVSEPPKPKPEPLPAPAPAPKPQPKPQPAPEPIAQARTVYPQGAQVPSKASEKVTVQVAMEFASDSAAIESRYQAEVKQLAEFLLRYSHTKVIIEGHTDNIGGADYNMGLAKRRTESLRSELVNRYRIAPQRVSTRAYGAGQPIGDNATSEGRRHNRRILAVISGG